jgi:hypothetical protein
MDRLAPSTFRDDEPVGVTVVEATSGAGSSSPLQAWIPERLFCRMLDLAAAYRLHVLGAVLSDVDTRLNDAQCESLLAELEYLARLVPSDLALQGVLAEVVPLVSRVARSGTKAELVVQPP